MLSFKPTLSLSSFNFIKRLFSFSSLSALRVVSSASVKLLSTRFVVVVQLLSHVRLFVTPWTVACQASLSFTISWSLPKFMFFELVIPSNHLILCYPLLLLPSIFLSIKVFPMSRLFSSGGQRIGVLASASVLPMNIQG